MYNGKTVGLVIAAGGSGSRMGTDIPKQYLKIGGRTVIEKCVEVFYKMGVFDKIAVACSPEYEELCRKLLAEYGAVFSEGGASRQKSVKKALEIVDTDYVLIHDAARPFVTEEVIRNVIEGAISYGGCICKVMPKDTVRTESMTLDRSRLYAVQTPQGFETARLKKAYEKAAEEGYDATDDAGVFEHAGGKVHLCEGDYRNIKITTKEDLPMETRCGTGYDVHKLVPERDCIIGGVNIPYEMGLLGHSDADVLVHAVMDALLGAAALGDIGMLFPDSDDRYKGISSIKLLEEVGRCIAEEGYEIGNIDAVVIAQKPKISPYIGAMRDKISQALGIEKNRVGIKGTTTEKLGFEGRGEGIAASAVCILNK